MESDNTKTWVSKYAELERQRRKDMEIVRAAAEEFARLLTNQVTSDLYEYYREFRTEAQHIERRTENGVSVVERTRDEGSVYTGDPCSVRVWTELNKMCVCCEFTHREKLNRAFSLIINAEGKLTLADCSIADLSKYILTPVLFDKLSEDDIARGTAGS